jgi:hypothetical protein
MQLRQNRIALVVRLAEVELVVILEGHLPSVFYVCVDSALEMSYGFFSIRARLLVASASEHLTVHCLFIHSQDVIRFDQGR